MTALDGPEAPISAIDARRMIIQAHGCLKQGDAAGALEEAKDARVVVRCATLGRS